MHEWCRTERGQNSLGIALRAPEPEPYPLQYPNTNCESRTWCRTKEILTNSNAYTLWLGTRSHSKNRRIKEKTQAKDKWAAASAAPHPLYAL